MNKKNLSWLIAALLLSACASEPMVTDTDVLVAENRGELQALYQRLDAELASSKASSNKTQNRQLYLTKVGRKIAEQQERDILNRLDRDLAKQDVSTLQQALADGKAIEPFNREIYLDLTLQLEKAINEKMQLINEKEQQFSVWDHQHAPQKVQLLDQIALLWGGDKAVETQKRRSDYLASLYQQTELALTHQRPEDVRRYLKHFQEIDPNYPDLDRLRHGLIIEEYEQQFWLALSKGQTDLAFATFKELNQIPDYLTKHPDVVPAAEEMMRYFIAQGNRYFASFSLSSAYQSFSRARYVKDALKQGAQYHEAEVKFIDYLARRLQTYVDNNQSIPAYGFISILQELQPEHALVAQHKESVSVALLDLASLKLVPTPFTAVVSDAELSMRLEQDVVTAVEQAIDGNHKMLAANAMSRIDAAKLANAASYYFIHAELIDAGTRLKEISAEENRKVLVSYQQVENPDYVAWTKLKKRDKKIIPEPAAIIEVPVEETVVLQKTLFEKESRMSVAYRLVSALDGQVVFADAINQSEIFTADLYQAFEQGLFVVEATEPNLPSDEAVLQQLSQSVAKEIASKIAERAQLLPVALANIADMSVVSEDFNRAASHYAFSDVLTQAEGKQNIELGEKLRNYAIRWKN